MVTAVEAAVAAVADPELRVLTIADLGILRGVEVVGETGDGLEAVDLVRRDPPDVILLDVTMPGLNGLEAAARISRLGVPTRVLMLSMHA